MAHVTQERRQAVRRRSDRELFELIEKKTGVKPDQLVRERKLRRAIRHTCKAVIGLDVSHAPGESGHWETDRHELKARVLDLSEGGASLFCKHELKQGAKCRLAIKLYDGSAVEAGSEVRWASHKPQKDGYALGFQFTQIDATNQRRLRAFLTDLDNTLGMGQESE
jgi:c-di-GMP-binding flagellar brake protein YcgR